MTSKLSISLNEKGFNYYLNQIKQIMEHPFSSLMERNRALQHVAVRLETYFQKSDNRDKLIRTALGYQYGSIG